MKKEIMEKWVEALESGDYAQCRGTLRKANKKKSKYGFCCLGVLCNIHAQEHPEIAAKETDPEFYLGYSGTLPPKVMSWSGIGDTNGWVPSLNMKLSTLNDNGKSFKYLAKVIRKHYKEL